MMKFRRLRGTITDTLLNSETETKAYLPRSLQCKLSLKKCYFTSFLEVSFIDK